MARAERRAVAMRIVIEQPVPGVRHSLQDKEGGPLDPKVSVAGEPLAFDFTIGVEPGPKFFGDQVRREGPQRRFVYIRIGDLAGDPASPWSRRMKIDIHDIARRRAPGAGGKRYGQGRHARLCDGAAGWAEHRLTEVAAVGWVAAVRDPRRKPGPMRTGLGSPSGPRLSPGIINFAFLKLRHPGSSPG